MGGIEGLCAVLIRLALPNHAPVVKLVIRQPQFSQPNMTSLPYIRQRGQLIKMHSISGQPIHPPPQVPSTICTPELYELFPVTV